MEELRIEGGTLASFAGVERWRDSLRRVSVVGCPTGVAALADLWARLPDVVRV
ncbi:hypothetical protein VSH64_10900 [Amycolatopsis rhabdoformis]|uniref:Uncharacterized protein n=1 Tax=Amycolatopsis rhabdoformis TaxID=1448059 RepID=A0ABZ1IGD3_9PSEU|nr:hypothetical protein [Amycolatopsis rhabdoformis]WSE32614.1 hypothetical protein VSH64_10900 [Amycolatopsis rhabdoformis]